MADLYLYEEIVPPAWEGFGAGISAKTFVNQLNELDGADVTLYVNSPGGVVNEAMTMHAALDRYPGTVTAVIDGWALSAASIVPMAAAEIHMSENAEMMIHPPWTSLSAQGGSAEMTELAEMAVKEADNLDRLGAQIANIYATKGNRPAEEFQAMMDSETWMSAATAKSYGLIDAVSGASEAELSIDPARMKYNIPERVQNRLRRYNARKQMSISDKQLAGVIEREKRENKWTVQPVVRLNGPDSETKTRLDKADAEIDRLRARISVLEAYTS